MLSISKPMSFLLVGALFFLYLYFAGCSAAQGDESSKSLEKLREFHDQFKSSVRPGNNGLMLQSCSPSGKPWLSKEDVFEHAPSEQIGGVFVINDERHKNTASRGLFEPVLNSNIMEIGVSRITVVAINMAKNGNAVATSDIVLSPVQVSGSSSLSEIEEKLK